MKGRTILLPSINVLTKVTNWLAIGAAVCLGLAMIIGVIDVVGTKFFNRPFPGMKELTEEFNVGLVFLAIAFVAMERGHIRITLLEPHMSKALRFALGVFADLLGVLISAFLSWRAFVLLHSAIQVGKYKAGIISIPEWPGNLAVFLGFGLLLVAYILILCRKFISNSQ